MMLSSVFYSTRHVSLILLIATIHRVVAQTQCFLPSGDVAAGDIPCNGSPETTDCCPSDYQCLPFTRLCYKPNPANVTDLLFARGSCTDQQWGPGCPEFCSAGELGSSALVAMMRCEESPEQYCCVEGSATSCSCTSSNTVDVAAPVAGTTSSSTSSPSSTTFSSSSQMTQSTATPLPESSPSAVPTPAASSDTPAADSSPDGNHLSTGAKVGIGIGVSIGTIVVSFGGILLMLYRYGDDVEDDEDALNDPNHRHGPPSTAHSSHTSSLTNQKVVSPSHWLGTAVEEASRRPFSEASSQYTTEIPYASSTTFTPTNFSNDRSIITRQWPLSSEYDYDYPQRPDRTHSPAFRSSHDILGTTRRNEV